MVVDFHHLPLVRKKELAKDTFGFSFSTNGKDMSFLPGQYITLKLTFGNTYETRDFSVASSPTNKETVQIVTKRGLSEYKKKLFSLEKEETVEMSFPTGGFILDTKDAVPQIFISGGIGITPFYSMLQFVFERKLVKPIQLFASFSTEDDIIFHKNLKQVENEMKSTQVIYTISKPTTHWKGEKGRISQELLHKYITDISLPMYYIVGKQDMVDDIFDMLQRMGIENNKIKVEYFSGY